MFDLTPDEWIAITLSLRIALVATGAALPFGIAVAWLLARKNFYGKALLDGIVHLPLVLPPVVTGYLLLIWFGQKGVIGRFPADSHPAIIYPAAMTASAKPEAKRYLDFQRGATGQVAFQHYGFTYLVKAGP